MLHTAVVRTAWFSNSKYTVDLVFAMYLVQLFLTTQQLNKMSFSSKTLKFYWRKSRIRRKNEETTSSYRQKALMQTTKSAILFAETPAQCLPVCRIRVSMKLMEGLTWICEMKGYFWDAPSNSGFHLEVFLWSKGLVSALAGLFSCTSPSPLFPQRAVNKLKLQEPYSHPCRSTCGNQEP